MNELIKWVAESDPIIWREDGSAYCFYCDKPWPILIKNADRLDWHAPDCRYVWCREHKDDCLLDHETKLAEMPSSVRDVMVKLRFGGKAEPVVNCDKDIEEIGEERLPLDNPPSNNVLST